MNSSDQTKPLVSAIISTYKSERFIRGRMENLLNQTIAGKLEIIIVDSNSPENEEAIVKEYLHLPAIRYIKTPERETIYKAWNRGIKLSSGKYITNANTDDRLRNDALEILADALENDNSSSLVYADQYIVNTPDADFMSADKSRRFYRKEYSILTLLEEYLPGPQSMWRSSLHFRDNIWFDESFRIAGDYDFACRVALNYNLKKINDVLGYYYRSDNNENLELQNLDQTIGEAIDVQEKYSRMFIESLSRDKRQYLLKKIRAKLLIPRILYSAMRKAALEYFPKFHFPARVFLVWIASVILECDGRPDEALKLCLQYEHDCRAQLLLRQIARINNNQS